jgi:hypothetical protein
MPPYQERLYAEPGYFIAKFVQAYWAARSPASLARKSAHSTFSTAASRVAAATGRRAITLSPRVRVLEPEPSDLEFDQRWGR